MKQQKFSTHSIVLVGLFAAICYVALYLKIPIPSPVGKPFLHLGNMFVILASLLFNGFIGGTAGSLGMGLYDILNGYASSVAKTIILKFGIGVITGYVAANKNKKPSKSPVKWIITASIAFIVIGVVLFSLSLIKGYQIPMPNIEKEFVINPVLYIFSFILGAALGVLGLLSKRFSIELQWAAIGAAAGIAFNLVGEFIFKVFVLLIAGSRFYPAVLAAIASLPATLINGTFSIIIAVTLYIPLSKTLSKFKFNI